MITDEMVEKALEALNRGQYHTDFSGRRRMRAALEAVEADIRNAALEEGAKTIEPEPVVYDEHHFKRGVCHGKKEAAVILRALRTKVKS